MKIEEIKQIWKRQRDRTGEDLSEEQIMMMLNNKLISFDEKTKRRDWLEIAAALITVLVCLAVFFYVESVWFRLGSITLIVASILIVYKLSTAQGNKTEEDFKPDRSFPDHLHDELKKMEAQKKLLESVFWWYLLPIFTGIVFFAIGFSHELLYKLIYLTVVVSLYVYIWKFNQDAVTKYINPIISDIEEAIVFINNKNE